MKSSRTQQHQAIKTHLFPIVTIDDDSNYNKVKPRQDFINLGSILGSQVDNNVMKSMENAENIFSTPIPTPRNNYPSNQQQENKTKSKRPISVPRKKWSHVADRSSIPDESSHIFPIPVTTPMLLASRMRPTTPPSSHRRKERNHATKYNDPSPPATASEAIGHQTNESQYSPDSDIFVKQIEAPVIAAWKKDTETLEEHFQKMNYLFHDKHAAENGKTTLAMEVLNMLQQEDSSPPSSSRTDRSSGEYGINSEAALMNERMKPSNGLPQMHSTGKKAVLAKPGKLKPPFQPNTLPLPPKPAAQEEQKAKKSALPPQKHETHHRSPFATTNVMLLADEIMKKIDHQQAHTHAHPHPVTDMTEDKLAHDVPVSVVAGLLSPERQIQLILQQNNLLPATDVVLLPPDLSNQMQRELERQKLLQSTIGGMVTPSTRPVSRPIHIPAPTYETSPGAAASPSINKRMPAMVDAEGRSNKQEKQVRFQDDSTVVKAHPPIQTILDQEASNESKLASNEVEQNTQQQQQQAPHLTWKAFVPSVRKEEPVTILPVPPSSSKKAIPIDGNGFQFHTEQGDDNVGHPYGQPHFARPQRNNRSSKQSSSRDDNDVIILTPSTGGGNTASLTPQSSSQTATIHAIISATMNNSNNNSNSNNKSSSKSSSSSSSNSSPNRRAPQDEVKLNKHIYSDRIDPVYATSSYQAATIATATTAATATAAGTNGHGMSMTPHNPPTNAATYLPSAAAAASRGGGNRKVVTPIYFSDTLNSTAFEHLLPTQLDDLATQQDAEGGGYSPDQIDLSPMIKTQPIKLASKVLTTKTLTTMNMKGVGVDYDARKYQSVDPPDSARSKLSTVDHLRAPTPSPAPPFK